MTADDAEAPRSRASDVLEATLEQAKMPAVKRLGLNVAAFAVSIFSGGGGEDVMPGLDLVVTRRDTGAEILRVRAGQYEEAGHVLEHTRRDLDTMTVEQFVRSWRSFDD